MRIGLTPITNLTSQAGEGLSRRTFLQATIAGGLALGAESVLPQSELFGAPARASVEDYIMTSLPGVAPKSVIVIWLGGGASHLDLYNWLPTTTSATEGPFRPTNTRVSGVVISSLLPRTANMLNEFALFRSIYHEQGDHGPATALSFTTRHEQINDQGDSRFNRSVKENVLSQLARQQRSIYLTMNANSDRAPYSGIQGRVDTSINIRCNFTGEEDYTSPLSGNIGRGRIADIVALRNAFDSLVLEDPPLQAAENSFQSAVENSFGPLGEAFDLNKEDIRIRERFGKNPLGNAALTAFRMVKASQNSKNPKPQIITINDGFWDSHWDLDKDLTKLAPRLDLAVTALANVLKATGLDENTIVVVGSEFGRAPRITQPDEETLKHYPKTTAGREHWPYSGFLLAFGGGINPRVVGEIDRMAQVTPRRDPVYHASRIGEGVLNLAGWARVHARNGVSTGSRFETMNIKG